MGQGLGERPSESFNASYRKIASAFTGSRSYVAKWPALSLAAVHIAPPGSGLPHAARRHHPPQPSHRQQDSPRHLGGVRARRARASDSCCARRTLRARVCGRPRAGEAEPQRRGASPTCPAAFGGRRPRSPAQEAKTKLALVRRRPRNRGTSRTASTWTSPTSPASPPAPTHHTNTRSHFDPGPIYALPAPANRGGTLVLGLRARRRGDRVGLTVSRARAVDRKVHRHVAPGPGRRSRVPQPHVRGACARRALRAVPPLHVSARAFEGGRFPGWNRACLEG